MIRIPNENKQIAQVNNSDVLGSLWSSFNLDLTTNRGRIRVSPRGMLVSSSSTLTNMETPVSFVFYDNGTNERIWTIAGARMFYSSGDPDDSFTEDATASTPTSLNDDCDMVVFNDAIYVCGDSSLYKYNGSWSTVSTAPNGGECSMCVFTGRLYASQSNSQIFSVDSADTVSEPGSPNTTSYTINLAQYGEGDDENNFITSIKATTDRIWIATINRAGSQSNTTGKRGRIFEWDGRSVTASNVYELNSLGAVSLVIKNNVPYAMDADGKLLRFNGSSFEEVARLPINNSKYLRIATNTPVQRFMHTRGMIVRDEKILLLVNNINVDGSTFNENLHSGIWEYDDDIGLYHKYSASLFAIGDSTRKDFGQIRLAEVGALFEAKTTDSGADGDLMFGAKYYTDATSTAYGIFTVNSKETKSKCGYFVTTKIESQNVQDTWKNIYAKYKRLLDSTDKIDLKYRTYETTPIDGTITWTSTTTFTSTASLGTITAGDEVEITRGTGGGQIEHISTITENAGTYTVTLENAVTGATGTATARFQKWIKIGTVQNQATDFTGFAIGKSSTWVQLKVVMYFTGENELHEILLDNKPYNIGI